MQRAGACWKKFIQQQHSTHCWDHVVVELLVCWFLAPLQLVTAAAAQLTASLDTHRETRYEIVFITTSSTPSSEFEAEVTNRKNYTTAPPKTLALRRFFLSFLFTTNFFERKRSMESTECRLWRAKVNLIFQWLYQAQFSTCAYSLEISCK